MLIVSRHYFVDDMNMKVIVRSMIVYMLKHLHSSFSNDFLSLVIERYDSVDMLFGVLLAAENKIGKFAHIKSQ